MTTAMILDRRALRPAPVALRPSIFVLLFFSSPIPHSLCLGSVALRQYQPIVLQHLEESWLLSWIECKCR
jgi:hypothetical protein